MYNYVIIFIFHGFDFILTIGDPPVNLVYYLKARIPI